jgi:hypothetical protein
MLRLLLLLLLVPSCVNPYQSAHATIAVGRGALALSDFGFIFYLGVEKQKCQDKCKAEPACVAKCMGPQNRIKMGFEQGKRVAGSSFDLADAIVNAAEKENKKEFTDWEPVVKRAACVVARLLVFSPPDIKKQVNDLLFALARYGCNK